MAQPRPGAGRVLGIRNKSRFIASFALTLQQAGGRIQGGRVLDYKDKPERQLCRLFLSMMDKMDQHPKVFGDAKMMLEEV